MTQTTLTEKEWFTGYMLLQQLKEQVDPVRINKLYLNQSDIAKKVIDTVKDLAPQGVSSQGEYLDTLEKALNTASKDFNAQTGDDNELADLDLSLSYIERKLRQIPYQVFFNTP